MLVHASRVNYCQCYLYQKFFRVDGDKAFLYPFPPTSTLLYSRTRPSVPDL